MRAFGGGAIGDEKTTWFYVLTPPSPKKVHHETFLRISTFKTLCWLVKALQNIPSVQIFFIFNVINFCSGEGKEGLFQSDIPAISRHARASFYIKKKKALYGIVRA